MKSHGPGPWKFVVCEPWDEEDEGKELPLDFVGYENQHTENPMIVDANGDRVVGHSEYNVFYSDRQKENVMLLLAAPDLLAAINFLLDCSAPMTAQQVECWTSLRAARAKATGGAA